MRRIVASLVEEYSQAISSKDEKSRIVARVLEKVRSHGAGFVKQDRETGSWYDVGNVHAREKISQAFRDLLHDQYKSSLDTRRKNRQAKRKETMEDNTSSSATSDIDSNKMESINARTSGMGTNCMETSFMGHHTSARDGASEPETASNDLVHCAETDNMDHNDGETNRAVALETALSDLPPACESSLLIDLPEAVKSSEGDDNDRQDSYRTQRIPRLSLILAFDEDFKEFSESSAEPN